MTGLISGRLYDAGYARTLVYVGSIINTAGLLATSFSTTYPQIFLSLGVCVGLGSGAFYVPSLAIVATHFDCRKRPLATGIAATGAGVGGVLYPILFRALVERAGFPWAIRSFACVNGGLLLVSSLLVSTLHTATSDNIPGDSSTSSSSPDTIDIPPSPSKPPKLKKNQLIDATAFYDRPFIFFSISLFLLWLGVDIPFFFFPSFASAKLRLSAEWGDYLLAIMNASAIVGRVLLGLAAVYAGSFLVWQVSIGASCVLLTCWMTITNLGGIMTFVVLYGGFTGGVISLVSAALMVISPDIRVVGTRLGMSSVLAGFGFLVGPPVAGAIQWTQAGYVGESAFAAGTYFGAFGVLVAVAVLHRRRKEVVLGGEMDMESSRVTLVQVQGAREQFRANPCANCTWG